MNFVQRLDVVFVARRRCPLRRKTALLCAESAGEIGFG